MTTTTYRNSTTTAVLTVTAAFVVAFLIGALVLAVTTGFIVI